MPLSDTDKLKQSRSDLVNIIAAKTADWVTNGCPPSYSIDGESVQWDQWLETRNKELQALTETIRILSSPWMIRSKGRP